MPNAFNTLPIDQPKRLAYWTDAICETFLTVECRQQGDGLVIHGEMQGCRLGSVGLIDVLSPPMEYYRGVSQLQGHDQEEHFQLILLLSGTGLLEQHGRQAILLPGDVGLYSATSPSSISYPEGSRTIALKIPRSELIERIESDEPNIPLAVKSNSALGAMIGAMVRESYNWGSKHASPSHPMLVSGMLDIIAFAFDMQKNSACEASRRGPLEQIKLHMQRHLRDPDFSLAQVVAYNNVSMRTLNRLFASEGTSANRWLCEQRLRESYKALSEGHVRQVSEAALSSGFNDLSYFSRVFKKAYGITPNQLLRRTDH